MMFIATINRTMLSWLFAIIGAEYILRWLPRGTHRWREFRKPELLKQLLASGGLEVAAQAGVAVNPFNRTFHLSRRMNVNYMLAAGKADSAAEYKA
jgi:2-polyprenyl-6-hydroxyphenyl methylase/3-demethylubiquinone-9 3-methyltransferase